MHPITPSIPEFEGHISKKKHSEDLTISIKAPGLKKSITIQAKLSPPEQPIRSNSYTKIHLKDLADGSVSELYIETSKIQALISKSGSFSPSNLPPPPPSESAVSSNTVLFADLEPTSASPFTVTGPISHSPFIIAEEPVFFSTSGLPKSIASSLKTHILTHDSFHMTRTVDTEYIFHNHEWHAIIAKPPKGTDSEVLICEKFAFKFLHNQTGWNEIKRSEAILERVNFDGTAIGIAKRPITELAEKNLTVYSLTASGLVTTENNQIQAQLEEVFQSDCLDAIDRIETFEIQSIASCIVQGSKTLIENGIYHLDTKLENIGYLGNGRAIHFDLGGSSDITEKEWINYSPAFTRRDNFKKELTNAILETNPDLKKNKLEKIHIFQLGSALFHLATKKIPYGNDPDKFIPPSTLESDFERLRKELQDSLAYSDSQIEIIAAMLSKKPIERPSIEEIQAVFPIDLILASNNPT